MITILTYCEGLGYPVYRRFVGSLFDTGFSGNVVYFIHSKDEEKLKKIQNEYGDTKVQYVICNNVSRVIQMPWPAGRAAEEEAAFLKINRMKSRFFFYQDYLNKAHIQSEHILLCDSSDVIFQKNLENYPYEEHNADLYVAQEGTCTLGDSGMNSKWIWRTHEILKDKSITNFPNERPLADKFIICAGTTLGSTEAIKKYVNTFCKIFEEHWDEFNNTASIPKLAAKVVGGLDQGLHNYLIYCDKLNLNIKIMSNEDDLVHTCGGHTARVRVNEFGEVTNLNGKVSYIVHQYDRFDLNDRKRMPILIKYRVVDRLHARGGSF